MTGFTPDMEDAAARYLIAARRDQRAGDRIPEACRPADVEAALGIQRRVAEMLGLPVGGWKCSVPSAERKVAAAPIFAPTITSDSPFRILPVGGKARIEPEIAFVIDRDLPTRTTSYSDVEVRAAIRETRVVLELLGSRYADAGAVTFPELLADNIANQGLFVGPVVQHGLELPLGAFPVAIDASDGALLARDGRHPDGHPLLPLVWLANYLAQQRGGLLAGQIVTTGSYCGAVDVPLDTALTVSFGDFGRISVRFSAAS
jgi:2-keto-4-pentenoate hydratase